MTDGEYTVDAEVWVPNDGDTVNFTIERSDGDSVSVAVAPGAAAAFASDLLEAAEVAGNE